MQARRSQRVNEFAGSMQERDDKLHHLQKKNAKLNPSDNNPTNSDAEKAVPNA